eukprot:5984645-Amphidinium_carterae.1
MRDRGEYFHRRAVTATDHPADSPHDQLLDIDVRQRIVCLRGDDISTLLGSAPHPKLIGYPHPQH